MRNKLNFAIVCINFIHTHLFSCIEFTNISDAEATEVHNVEFQGPYKNVYQEENCKVVVIKCIFKPET